MSDEAAKRLFERALMLKSSKDPRDGDGDGMIFDGTPQERPVYGIEETAKPNSKIKARTIKASVPEGWYRLVEERNGKEYWAGPFRTEQHAFDNAYANNELDSRKSRREQRYTVAKDGNFKPIRHSKYMMEDVEAWRSEGEPVKYRLVDIPVPVYSNLLDEDGLLSL